MATFRNLLCFVLLAVLLVSCSSRRAQRGAAPEIADFISKSNKSFDLIRYDNLAWHSTDSLQAQETPEERALLDGTWFMLKDTSKTWHAFYGATEADTFMSLFHYRVDVEGNFVRQQGTAPFSQQYLNAVAVAQDSALTRALAIWGPKTNYQYSLNGYLLFNEDKPEEVEIIYLPGFQTNNAGIFGAIFAYKSNLSEQTFEVIEETMEDSLQGWWINKSDEIHIRLWNTGYEYAPFHAVFTAEYYARFLKEGAHIWTKKYHYLVQFVDGQRISAVFPRQEGDTPKAPTISNSSSKGKTKN